MKQYKHKNLWFIATLQSEYDLICSVTNPWGMKWLKPWTIQTLFVVNSQDWEEIKQEDIFEKIWDGYLDSELADINWMKKAIKKHLWITRNEINELIWYISNSGQDYIEKEKLGYRAKSKWLLID